MKKYLLTLTALIIFPVEFLWAQEGVRTDTKSQAIYTLINNYLLAREKKDTILLRTILTSDIDQLVSTGKWRYGISEAINGMLQSSESNPGSRTLKVEKIRFLDLNNAIVDARYEIKNPDSTIQKMWSSFVVVHNEGRWKITAIRNMLPSAQ